MSQIFERKLNALGITITETQKRQFVMFYELLIKWNQVMNLTGITEYEEVNEKHFVDSLSVVKAIDVNRIESVIDIGTGAGFPGIPLKIVFPHLNMVLLDSLNKRISFLNEVISALGLENIRTIHGRAEDFAKQAEYRGEFDLCVSRAVANLSTLSEYCLPYVHKEGLFVPYKSGEIDEEVRQAEKAIHILGGNVDEIIKFQLPETEIGRSFVKIRKMQDTPKRYPRKAGLPAKEPLG